MRDLVLEELPGTFVSCSHEISPGVGEYARMSTTAGNAALGPLAGRYLSSLEAKLQKAGMNARDVQWVSTGTDASARVKMMQGGQIDASLVVAPAYFKLEAQGFNVVDLLVNHPDIFVSTAYVFKKSWVKDNPELPSRLIMAQAEAIQRFYEDKAAAVQAYRAFDPQDEADVSRLYDIYRSKDVLDRVPLLPKAAVHSAIARMADDLPAIKAFDAGTVVDMGAVRKLVADGWFRKLFGAGIAAEEQRKLAGSF